MRGLNPFNKVKGPFRKVSGSVLLGSVSAPEVRAFATGTGTVSATAVGNYAGESSLSSSASLSVGDITKSIPASAPSMSGSASVTVSGVLTYSGVASLTSSATISASGVGFDDGTATLAGTGSITASGLLTQLASTSLSGIASIASDAAKSLPAESSLTSSASILAAGDMTFLASASLSGSASTSSSGLMGYVGASSMSASGSISSDGTVSGGALGLKNVTSIASNVVFEITPTLTQSVASNTAQALSDAHGDTSYSFHNGSGSGADSADGIITGAGTSAGQIRFGDNDNAQFNGTPPTFLQTLDRNNVARTMIWAGDISSGAGQFALFGHTNFIEGIFIFKRDASSTHTLRFVSYTGATSIVDCAAVPTGQANLIVMTWNNGALSYAINSRTFTSAGSFTSNGTGSSSGTPLLIGPSGEALGASDTIDLFNLTFLDTDITNTELADIVDHFRTNYDDLSGLPAS